MKDQYYMNKAIQLAKKGMYTARPNPIVGCIITKKNRIVGTGWHQKSGEYHAEVYAINMAGLLSKNATAYISLEPCNHFGKTPPCCDLIISSGIKRVVVAILDPNPIMSGKSIEYLKSAGISVTIGIMSEEAKKINLGFFKRMTTGIPWIQLKMAISIDGKIAMESGESKWITGIHARKDTHQFRALSSAILSTSKTILNDNPTLTVRYCIEKFHQKKYVQPVRIIIDSKNQIQPKHKIIKDDTSEIWLIKLHQDQNIWPKHVKQIIISKYKKNINLKELFKLLGVYQINTVFVECGAHLFSSMIQLKLVDEIILYIAPKMLGNVAQPLYYELQKFTLDKVKKFIFTHIKKIGSDIRIILKPIF
ncbi:bifunctional diaminohydroxyphosphoribosylaminopyrimidine deaminase/5-amino-6-(5-phosphoribosylamino)uracil reductase RibD [Buchnera aphidicola (Sarucallis kahawaluokalani)]|uniref:Riboflavin biosynthesis protein RibD n=1 Tax=Buchnera aphidicola (Sarucallis kahawaluokalani) TaxID=1241878 RepID=A0A4D6YKL0_9GAMM|nr:bifunctional diaminohydroxyphosphoribosylaminopyrimidine deaminase/5-amino-6-(5-phosphoribosylamino)uracil reductase RibD [Buchnera aphidicola (Sarucallis kahawaluokalani)]